MYTTTVPEGVRQGKGKAGQLPISLLSNGIRLPLLCSLCIGHQLSLYQWLRRRRRRRRRRIWLRVDVGEMVREGERGWRWRRVCRLSLEGIRGDRNVWSCRS
jgi:hypothetical protein